MQEAPARSLLRSLGLGAQGGDSKPPRGHRVSWQPGARLPGAARQPGEPLRAGGGGAARGGGASPPAEPCRSFRGSAGSPPLRLPRQAQPAGQTQSRSTPRRARPGDRPARCRRGRDALARSPRLRSAGPGHPAAGLARRARRQSERPARQTARKLLARPRSRALLRPPAAPCAFIASPAAAASLSAPQSRGVTGREADSFGRPLPTSPPRPTLLLPHSSLPRDKWRSGIPPEPARQRPCARTECLSLGHSRGGVSAERTRMVSLRFEPFRSGRGNAAPARQETASPVRSLRAPRNPTRCSKPALRFQKLENERLLQAEV